MRAQNVTRLSVLRPGVSVNKGCKETKGVAELGVSRCMGVTGSGVQECVGV